MAEVGNNFTDGVRLLPRSLDEAGPTGYRLRVALDICHSLRANIDLWAGGEIGSHGTVAWLARHGLGLTRCPLVLTSMFGTLAEVGNSFTDGCGLVPIRSLDEADQKASDGG